MFFPGPSSRSSNAVQRIWTLQDEMIFIEALARYKDEKNDLPPLRWYDSICPEIVRRLSFNSTATQLYNKQRAFRTMRGNVWVVKVNS